ncbi:hypothetical protein [Sporomusa sp.]|uniref:hypothetical protein n=1 Tax=Sporomusa sp. TaxID=2078658 RepID=UPI002C29CC23|nr:hypothetical protein [Sporomusa sp.]HWR07469.1 hypothetical protein [Sporomusa sp.]
MKKLILTTMLASLTLAGTAFASVPGIDTAAGQGEIGYSHYNLESSVDVLGDMGKLKNNNFQAAYGLSDKLAITGDYLNSESQTFYSPAYGYFNDMNLNSTEIGLQYKLNKNIAVSVGNVKSELKASNDAVSTSEMFAGVAYRGAVANKVDSYASYIRSENVQDWKAGLTYGVGSNVTLDAGYRSFENNDLGIKAKGMGFGANYKF